MWLSGLHIPESYLTALVQATCRKNGWPLDKSTLYTTVTHYLTPEDVTERAHQGKVAEISGVWVDGFRVYPIPSQFFTIPYVLQMSSQQSVQFSKLMCDPHCRVLCDRLVPWGCWMGQQQGSPDSAEAQTTHPGASCPEDHPNRGTPTETPEHHPNPSLRDFPAA